MGAPLPDGGRHQLPEEVDVPVLGRGEPQYVGEGQGRPAPGCGDAAGVSLHERPTEDEEERVQAQPLHSHVQDCAVDADVGHSGVLRQHQHAGQLPADGARQVPSRRAHGGRVPKPDDRLREKDA